MRKLVIPALAAILLAAPAGALAGDLPLGSLRVSVDFGTDRHRHEPPPRVVYVYRDDRDYRDFREHRHRRHRHGRHEEARLVVLDRDRRHCDDERVVVVRPGTTVVVAGGRRW